MKCFNHADRDAVGICKSCGKGLCTDCQVDLGRGLACKDRCEGDVKAWIALTDHNIRFSRKSPGLLRSTRMTYAASGLLFITVGGVFLAWGLKESEGLSVLTVGGACFVAYGLFAWIRVAMMPRADDLR